MSNNNPHSINDSVIDEFRRHGGRVGGWLEGARLLLLTTTGARTGRPHTVPLGYLPDGGERVLVIGSAGGSSRHPAWYHNLLAHPEATVEAGAFTYQARATVLTGEERDRAFVRAVEHDPGWRDYQDRAGRDLPVVALAEIPGPPRTRAATMGELLGLIHTAFRRELELIRAEVAGSGGTVGAQLRVNCLTVCHGLHAHHTTEETRMFVALGQQRPDLGPVLDLLRAQHETIAALVDQLRRTLDDRELAPAVLRDEVERLTVELGRHLDDEEAELLPLLDFPV